MSFLLKFEKDFAKNRNTLMEGKIENQQPIWYITKNSDVKFPLFSNISLKRIIVQSKNFLKRKVMSRNHVVRACFWSVGQSECFGNGKCFKMTKVFLENIGKDVCPI